MEIFLNYGPEKLQPNEVFICLNGENGRTGRILRFSPTGDPNAVIALSVTQSVKAPCRTGYQLRGNAIDLRFLLSPGRHGKWSFSRVALKMLTENEQNQIRAIVENDEAWNPGKVRMDQIRALRMPLASNCYFF